MDNPDRPAILADFKSARCKARDLIKDAKQKTDASMSADRHTVTVNDPTFARFEEEY
ncbi:conserved hypothetical protein [Culex quinquefasciatus]|uniref:Uncharacterized protein n=1 Tax=Culex quinquefasciatus TaxID=7176 RepID=B0XIV9_CULQU|nr:conserved hypothetical protein [Culex quinquefasciatus]|eukprot:XP_001869581.1 conserved hypothetical protein [Culex quinquefasciatus]